MVDSVLYLIEKGANVNEVDDTGISALHRAASNNHYEVIKILLSNGANPNTKTMKDYTPLMHACAGGNEQIIEILLKYGADSTVVDKVNNKSTLHISSIVGCFGRMQMLLQNNYLNVNAEDNDLMRPIHYASLYGHVDIVKLLIEKCTLVNVRSTEAVTPLHCASYEGHLKVVKVIKFIIFLKSDLSN